MRTFAQSAVVISLTAALLAGCGGSQPPIGTVNKNFGPPYSHHRAFHYTGKEQLFIVPMGVTHVAIVASGASGPYAVTNSCSVTGGRGGLVQAAIHVTPGEKLAVFVGGEGDSHSLCNGSGYDGKGGFNGGGDGGAAGPGIGSPNRHGAGGGGASDVRQGGSGLRDRVVVAAGGAGPGGYAFNNSSGAGGGKIGGRGSGQSGSGYCVGYGGAGGTQNKGGKAGRGGPSGPSLPGKNGALGQGGAGGDSLYDRKEYGAGGGGGGGGYFGGGGGGSGARCTSMVGAGGGGGGGSSYVEPGATDVTDQKGAASPGNGKIVISW